MSSLQWMYDGGLALTKHNFLPLREETQGQFANLYATVNPPQTIIWAFPLRRDNTEDETALVQQQRDRELGQILRAQLRLRRDRELQDCWPFERDDIRRRYRLRILSTYTPEERQQMQCRRQVRDLTREMANSLIATLVLSPIGGLIHAYLFLTEDRTDN